MDQYLPRLQLQAFAPLLLAGLALGAPIPQDIGELDPALAGVAELLNDESDARSRQDHEVRHTEINYRGPWPVTASSDASRLRMFEDIRDRASRGESLEPSDLEELLAYLVSVAQEEPGAWTAVESVYDVTWTPSTVMQSRGRTGERFTWWSDGDMTLVYDEHRRALSIAHPLTKLRFLSRSTLLPIASVFPAAEGDGVRRLAGWTRLRTVGGERSDHVALAHDVGAGSRRVVGIRFAGAEPARLSFLIVTRHFESALYVPHYDSDVSAGRARPELRRVNRLSYDSSPTSGFARLECFELANVRVSDATVPERITIAHDTVLIDQRFSQTSATPTEEPWPAAIERVIRRAHPPRGHDRTRTAAIVFWSAGGTALALGTVLLTNAVRRKSRGPRTKQ